MHVASALCEFKIKLVRFFLISTWLFYFFQHFFWRIQSRFQSGRPMTHSRYEDKNGRWKMVVYFNNRSFWATIWHWAWLNHDVSWEIFLFSRSQSQRIIRSNYHDRRIWVHCKDVCFNWTNCISPVLFHLLHKLCNIIHLWPQLSFWIDKYLSGGITVEVQLCVDFWGNGCPSLGLQDRIL